MRLAAQLYTVRHALDDDFDGTLAALAEAGVVEVEIAGLHGRSAAAMRAALDAAGLGACSAHISLDAFDGAAEAAAALGAPTVVVPWVEAPETAEEADATVERIVAASELAAEAELGFAYHNHDFEFRTGLWDRLVAAELPHELDVGWAMAAGRDPVTLLGELAGRCPLVHAKDMRRRADGSWEDVIAGDGEADWPAVVEAAKAAGATHLIVELDNPSEHPVDDVALSLATLRDAL
jgi:sugar phosphate isomerase/epimerase